MRTTVRLDDDLLLRAKGLAASQGRTLTAVIEDGLRAQLARADRASKPPPVELPTFGRAGERPRVDLDDSAALLELMEEARPGEERR